MRHRRRPRQPVDRRVPPIDVCGRDSGYLASVHEPRSLALDILRRVSTQGAYAGAALRALLPREWSGPDRGLTTELVYGVLRRRGQIDRALRKAAGRRLKDLDPRLHDVLRLGAYQLLFLERVPDHAAVHTTVELAKPRTGPRGAARVNQILRGLADQAPDARLPEPPPFEQDPVAHLCAVGSLGSEVAAALIEALGPAQALAYALASLGPGPRVLRTNLLRGEPQALCREVGGQLGHVPYAVHLSGRERTLPADLPAVREGRASPQDEASMRVVELLDLDPGMTVLDVCAAPGGKTGHIAERMRDVGRVLAHDRRPKRLAQVKQNIERLGLTAVELQEVLPPPSLRADRVLVDAPCSGLGTLRQHPEIRWRFARSDLRSLHRTQDAVLRAGAERVRPGGLLVYSVCTVTASEGLDRVTQLPGFEVEHVLRTGPEEPGAPDGFFAARLRRAPA